VCVISLTLQRRATTIYDPGRNRFINFAAVGSFLYRFEVVVIASPVSRSAYSKIKRSKVCFQNCCKGHECLFLLLWLLCVTLLSKTGVQATVRRSSLL
jgi:hypothetical protein